LDGRLTCGFVHGEAQPPSSVRRASVSSRGGSEFYRQLAAGDRYGQVIDVLPSEQRDTTAALRFFTCALAQSPAPVALLH
jgi:hypothetical protein